MRLRRWHLVLLAGIFFLQMVLNSSFLWCWFSSRAECGTDLKDDPGGGNWQLRAMEPDVVLPYAGGLSKFEINLAGSTKSTAFPKSYKKNVDLLRQVPTKNLENEDDKNISSDRWNISHLDLQMGNAWQWQWIRRRIHHIWPEWVSAHTNLSGSLPFKKKKILVVPGLLSLTEMARPEVIAGGGPLGELVQWSDLIAALHILGHHVELQHSIAPAKNRLNELGSRCHEFDPGCGCIDLIYTDYIGIRALPRNLRAQFKKRFRVLDVYGTEAMFNDPAYARSHNIIDPPALGLHLKQFLTMYPMTHDNTFLGFAVPAKKSNSTKKKENIGLLYGKDIKYIKGKLQYLWALRKQLDLYSTMPRHDESDLKSLHITNMGLVSNKMYQTVATRAKVLVGLGDPIEGTGVMEALSGGSVFINPRFTGEEQAALRGKPTTRKVTSQVPYLEWYVGPPQVLTLSINNLTEVVTEVKKVVKMETPTKEVSPLLPYEFSVAGYLHRLALHVHHQDYCGNSLWPPKSSLKQRYSKLGESCTETCQNNGLVCEPALFEFINNIDSFKKDHKCISTQVLPDVYLPAYIKDQNGGTCVLQADTNLFSCAGGKAEVLRLCPCRNFQKSPYQQVALCDECI